MRSLWTPGDCWRCLSERSMATQSLCLGAMLQGVLWAQVQWMRSTMAGGSQKCWLHCPHCWLPQSHCLAIPNANQGLHPEVTRVEAEGIAHTLCLVLLSNAQGSRLLSGFVAPGHTPTFLPNKALFLPAPLPRAAAAAEQLRARSRLLPPHINLFPPQAPERGWGVTAEPLQNQSLMSTLTNVTSSARDLHHAEVWTHQKRTTHQARDSLEEWYCVLQKYKRNWRWVTMPGVQSEQWGKYFWKVLCFIYWLHQTRAVVLCQT